MKNPSRSSRTLWHRELLSSHYGALLCCETGDCSSLEWNRKVSDLSSGPALLHRSVVVGEGYHLESVENLTSLYLDPYSKKN